MNVRAGRFLQGFLLIAFFAALFIGSYIWYRNNNANAIQIALAGASTTDLQSYKPAVCTFSSNTFDRSLHGTMYIAQGNTRTDYSLKESNRSYAIHMIRTSDGIAKTWIDNTDTVRNNSIIEELNLAGASFACMPWWSRDDSVFSVPDGAVVLQ